MKAKTWMQILVVLVAVLLVSLSGAIAFVNWKVERLRHTLFAVPRYTLHDEMAKADPELGKRIATIRNGCVDCHGADLAGHVFIDDGAIGTYYGPNLTPTHLGDWTDEQIATAIRYGVKPDAHPLIGMPSFDYQDMSKQDIANVVAYLRSLPPNDRDVPRPRIGPLAKFLFLAGKMPLLLPALSMNLSEGFGKKPNEEVSLEFGAYLTRTACTGCHGADLKGGPIQGAPPDWPSASNLHLASLGWTEEMLMATFKTGVSAKSQQTLRSPMPVEAFKLMNETEVKAIWLYLSSLP